MKKEFGDYLVQQIADAPQRISPKMTKSDRMDSGRVAFLTALKHVVDGGARFRGSGDPRSRQ